MRRAVNPWTDWRCYSQCINLIRRTRPHVVHTHSSKAGIIGRFAARRAGVPVVVHTIHGLPFHEHQSGAAYRLYVALERAAARRCDAIVCVADAMTRQALAAGVGRAQQYTTIYSGMKTEPFIQAQAQRQATRRQLGFTAEDHVIGTVARLAELKGHDDLLDAIGPMMRDNPRLHMLWVGDGWWRDRLTRRIEQAGLTGRVHLTGLVDPQRIPALMAAMDLLVHPSYREGLPRTIPQALLCRTPVVSYDNDGAPEVCIDGQTGKLAPSGDRQALGEAVGWMIEHPAEASAMAQRGQALCSQRFAASTMVEQLEQLYRRLLEKRPGGSPTGMRA
jgi:glycosyltransferase involved in cell wall biosynthesis